MPRIKTTNIDGLRIHIRPVRGYVLRRQFSVVATTGLAIVTEAIRELDDQAVDILAGQDDF
jgi:hypothetical protein